MDYVVIIMETDDLVNVRDFVSLIESEEVNPLMAYSEAYGGERA